MEEHGLFCKTSRRRRALHSLRLVRKGGGFVLGDNPLSGKVEWNVRVIDTGSRRDA